MTDQFVFQENIQGDLIGTESRGAGERHVSRGSRAEMEKHFKQLPVHIRQELRAGKLRLGDQIIYSIKAVGSSQTIKMFETQDQKETGVRNISNGKLPKNQALLVSGIYLLAGVAPAAIPGSPTEDEIKATPFKPLSANDLNAAIVNGEFNLKANKVQLIPETSMRVFGEEVSLLWPEGFYKLDNPRLIRDDELIEATIELGTVTGIPTDTYIYFALKGTITTP